MPELATLFAKLTPVTVGMDLFQVVTAVRIQAIQDALVELARGSNIRSGNNIRRKTGADWVMFSANPAGEEATAGVALDLQPFDATLSGSEETGYTFKLEPGTMNSLLPSNMFDEFTCTHSEILQIKVRGVSDGKKITGCSMVCSAADPNIQTPVQNALPTSVDVVTGVIFEGTYYRVISDGSLIMNGAEQFRTDKTSPGVPGTMAYIPWYVWRQAV